MSETTQNETPSGKATVECSYQLDSGYPADLFFNTDIEERLTGILGISESSGMGFGCRDNQWSFKTRAAAEAAEDAVETVFKSFSLTLDTETCYTGITHQHWSDDWDNLDEPDSSLMYPDEDCPESENV